MKVFIVPILTFIFLFTISNSEVATLSKVVLDDPDALCLDGTQGAYYVREGTQTDKFMLYFEGGGWCGLTNLDATLQSCYQRSKTDLGSSSKYPDYVDLGGIFSDASQNSFKSWTRVFLKYCDGTVHQGTKSTPVSYKGSKLYFRGNNITRAQFQSLEDKFGLFTKSSQVIVSGESAGGLAAFLWTEYVNRNVKNAKVYGVPDSGIFLDSINVPTGVHTYRNQFETLFKLSNLQIDPPTPKCVQKNPNQKHLCMFAENIYQQITAPIFPVQSLYDTSSILNDIGVQCISGQSLEKCSDKQKEQIEQNHQSTKELLKNITENQRNGCWAPVCTNHVYMNKDFYYNQNYRIPMKSNNSIDASLVRWVKGQEGGNQHIDDGQWPDNEPCDGIKHKKQIHRLMSK